MFSDKSRLLLFGALALLFVTLYGGGMSFHGIGFLAAHGWVKIALIAFAIYLLVGRGGCCRCSAGVEEGIEEEAESSGPADENE